ncbi:MAG: hypothetical protein AAF466_08700 [Bacteroidota bacterium]
MLFLAISLFVASCTPQEMVSENSENTAVDIYATGDDDNSSHDDDREG